MVQIGWQRVQVRDTRLPFSAGGPFQDVTEDGVLLFLPEVSQEDQAPAALLNVRQPSVWYGTLAPGVPPTGGEEDPWPTVVRLDQDDLLPQTPPAVQFVPRPPPPANLFTETEERSFATGGGGGRYVTHVQRQPTAGPARSRNMAFTDEDPRPTPAFTPDEEMSLPPAVQVRAWVPVVFTEEEATHALPLEDEAATPLPTQATTWPWVMVRFLDEEAANTLPLEDEAAAYPAVQARPWAAVSFLDKDATPQNFPLEQEEPWVATFQARPWVPVNFPDENPGPQLVNFPREQEDSWPQLSQARLWGTFIVLDEHPFATPPTNLYDDEQPPLVNVNVAQARPWLPLYFPDEDAGSPLRNFPLEQEEPWAGARQDLRWPVTQVLTDTDERGVLPPLEDGEHLPLTSLARQAVPWTSLPFTDEHAGASLKHFGLEQEEGWTARVTTTVWQARVFTDEVVTVVFIPPVPAVVTLTDRYAPTVTLTGRVGR